MWFNCIKQPTNRPATPRKNNKMDLTAATAALPATKPMHCLCGCKFKTSPTANYLPGHDAAHVSRLLGQVKESGDFSQSNVDRLAAGLPSPSLRFKFQRAVDRLATAKSTKSAKSRDQWVYLSNVAYRIGRWSYPVQARASADSAIIWHFDDTTDSLELNPGTSDVQGLRRNSRRDGQGEWLELAGGHIVRI